MMNKPNKNKCKRDVLEKYIRDNQLVEHFKDPSKKDLQELIDIVHTHNVGTTSTDDECSCDVCGGDSNANLDACPYCGDTDVEDEEPSTSDDSPKLSSDAQEQVSAKTGKKKAKKKIAKKAKKKVAKKATKKVAKKAKKKVAKKANRRIGKTGTPDKKASSAKLAKSDKQLNVKKSKALEKSLKDIRRLQLKGIECMHDLGGVLLKVYEDKLYTQMTDGDGKPIYDSWTKFCSREIGFSARHAYRLMDISIHFSKEDVSQIGVTKLTMLINVPEEKRKELLEKATNTPCSELSKEVAKHAQGNTREPREGFKGTSNEGKINRSKKLTIVRSEPRVVVDLFKAGGTARAKELDGATGVEQCANGVRVFYSLMTDKEGRISIAIETRREG